MSVIIIQITGVADISWFRPDDPGQVIKEGCNQYIEDKLGSVLYP